MKVEANQDHTASLIHCPAFLSHRLLLSSIELAFLEAT